MAYIRCGSAQSAPKLTMNLTVVGASSPQNIVWFDTDWLLANYSKLKLTAVTGTPTLTMVTSDSLEWAAYSSANLSSGVQVDIATTLASITGGAKAYAGIQYGTTGSVGRVLLEIDN